MNQRHFFAVIFLSILLLQLSSAFAVLPESTIKVFAVTTDGGALSADLDIEISPGNGRILTEITPLVGTATQSTERIAVDVAANYFKSVKNYNYIFSIKSNAAVVDGPSAGGAMALLVVSSLQDKTLPPEVGMTGTIVEDGSIGAVGGVFEKAKKASEVGIKLFMIPKGEATQIVKLNGGIQNVNLPEYALKNWGMKIVEVKNLDEVLKLAFSKIEDINVSQSIQEAPEVFIPQKIDVAPKALPLSALTKIIVGNTKGIVDDAKKSLSSTLIEDSSLINALLQSLNDSEKTLSESELLLQNNYLYSAGNFAFLSKVNAYLVKDLADNPSILQSNSSYTETKLTDLKAKIDAFKVTMHEFVPVEGLEWVVAAQQRLSWAELNVIKLLNDKTVVAVDPTGTVPEYATLIEKLRDYEFARAWFEASQDLYGISIDQSQNKIKTDSSFKDYYSELIVNTENGLTVIADNKDEPQRRLDAAKLNQADGDHLSAAMNAASALALVNASLSSQDKDSVALEKLLKDKITSVEQKMASFKHEFAWPNLYLDHAKYFLNSAEHSRETNQGTDVHNSLLNGITLAFLAENTLLVTEDMLTYYDSVNQSKLIPIDHSGSAGTGGTGIQVIPTVKVQNPFASVDRSLLANILLILLVGGVGVVIGVTISRKSSSEKPSFSPLSSHHERPSRQQTRISQFSSPPSKWPQKKTQGKGAVGKLKKSESEKGVLSED